VTTGHLAMIAVADRVLRGVTLVRNDPVINAADRRIADRAAAGRDNFGAEIVHNVAVEKDFVVTNRANIVRRSPCRKSA
jgi:hypothetical protein